MQLSARRNQGLIIYHLDHEGRANGLVAKLRSFGRDLGSVDFEERYNKLDDQRRFDTAVTIIRDLGVSAVNLITNNPDKKRILEREGISVVSVIPVVATDRKLQAYYEFKRTQLRHLIPRH
jgi:GTP cyclohydrolase II